MSKTVSKKFSKIILLSVGFVLFFSQCKHKAERQIDKGFTSYINGFTSGIISNSDPILIELSEEQDVKVGKKIEKELFSFTPKINGKAVWIDKFTIEFSPDNILPGSKQFDAVFHLGDIVDVPNKYKDFEFSFQTKTQAIDVDIKGLQAYNLKDLSWQRLEGTLKTADFADIQKIESILSAVQNAKRKKISWTHESEQKIHHFVIDSIYRGDKESEVIVQWDGSAIGAKYKQEKVVKIPSINNFSVMNVALVNEPDQSVKVYFSDPVSLKQNLRGLVHFKDKTPIRLSVDGNTVKIYPKKRIKKATELIIERSVRNSMGRKLYKRFKQKIKFVSLKPDVQAMSKGVILPDAKGLIFPFKAVNLKAVNVKIIKIFEDNVPQFFQVNQFDGRRELKRVGRVIYKKEVSLKSDKMIDYGQWNSFALDLSELIKIERGAVYRVQITFDKKQSLFDCGSDTEDETTENSNNDESAYDGPSGEYYYYDDYYDDYNYSERNNPCKKSYYHSGKHKIIQNVFASNFGIIAQEDANHRLQVNITDLISTKYLSGVEVEVYNYQHQLLGKGSTNSEGQAILDLENKPFLLVAKKNGQFGYLRLDDGAALSLSMFNVGGNKIRKGVKGYIYGERGVWRPGDSIFLNFILEDRNRSLPENHPVVMEIYTPENQLFSRKVKTQPVNNFYDFKTATPQDVPTGNWTARVKVGGSTFSKTLKIEAIKPNRLKINLNFESKILHNNNLSGILQAKWLHGATASGLKSIVEMKVAKGRTTFANYKDYYFDDPTKNISGEEDIIFDGRLDGDGRAVIHPKIDVGNEAPGMLKVNLKTRVFEKGGDFSIDRISIPYSPYQSYVGVKIPKGKAWNDALYSDEVNLIPIVTVDEYGKPVNRKNLKIEVYEISWRWWWQRNNNEDLGYYIRSSSSKKILTDYMSTKNGKAIYSLKFPEETWGRKLIVITDPVSNHSTGKIFYTDYKGWWSNPDHAAPGGAEMLTFNTDKKKYEIGEEVKINLPISEQGKALISIENGSKVVESFWVDISKNHHQVNFVTTEQMAPNVYVHISYIQPHSQTENDRPIRLYGVQGISVENPDSHLNPIIEMPSELRPEQKVSIKVKEASGKKMTYTIAVVDEGLLDLTHFKTPNPWNTFYAREALGVKTYDIYNYVMGAFSGNIAGLLAIGGDEDLIESGTKKANRFKPVVKFMGPFVLEKGKKNTHTFIMPNYIGSVRAMVVAGNMEAAYGSAEKTIPVKKPLMVLASLPRVLGPEENVKLPVTIFVMDKKIKNVKVKVQSNELLQVNNQVVKQIHFDKEGDQIVNFDLRVAGKVGVGKVKIIATGGGEKATYEVELNIRVPNPKLTNIVDGMLNAHQSWDASYVPIGITGTNKAVLEVSAIPPINLEKRLKYLIQYPHGCIEQTTSSVFPQLYLSDLTKLSKVKQAEVQDNIRQALQRLKKFQLTNGGFTYWPGESGYASDWGSNYAGHFLLEAKKKGYALPQGMLRDWIRYQTNRANDWSPNKSQYNYARRSGQMIQAYRLFTLSLAGKPALGAMNRLREITNLYPTAQWRLIAAYRLAGKKSVADRMMQNLSTKVDQYKELGYSYGSSSRDEAMILEALVLMNKKAMAKQILDKVSANLASESWMSTQTTAYSLLAVSKFVQGDKKGNMKFIAKYSGGKQKIDTDKPVVQIPLKFANNGASSVSVENKSEKTLFARIINQGIPLESKDLAFSKNLEMRINYFDVNGKTIDPTALKQGTDFVIEVQIKHPGVLLSYENMALTQIFPSGWEITNSRMDNIQRWKSDSSTYQDVRDDRVMTYFNLGKYKTKTYRIMANASYLGEYYLPSVKCEAMYDNNIISITNGKWVKVVK